MVLPSSLRPGARRAPRLASVVAIATGAALIAGCSSSDSERRTPAPTLTWSSCNDPVAADPALQCATLTVPLDYTKPKGATIDLALIRHPATSARTGALLTNPGGPGGSGFDLVAQTASDMRERLDLDGFDIVGFDPRGVDRSGGLRCFTDAQMDAVLYLDRTPDTPEERAELKRFDEAITTACTDKYGDTLKHYSTANTARDIDAIRAALGDKTISYFGISYGTYLGALYATMFPDRVRAMVLDSGYEPGGETTEQQLLTQLVGFERAFDNWAAWCEREPGDCPFHTTGVAAAWDALERRLDANPVTHTDGRAANQSVLWTATVASLYSRELWPVLGRALADVQGGDATVLFLLADGYNGRREDGTFTTLHQSNSVIDCASGFRNRPPADLGAFARQIATESPRFGRAWRIEDLTPPCDPSTASVTLPPLSYRGTAPIMVIGGANDPATPLRWSEELVAALGRDARLVTYTGEGHGFALVSTCVGEQVSALLTTLVKPASGTQCEPDRPAERPQWWASVTSPAGVSDGTPAPEALRGLLGLPTSMFAEVRTTEEAAPTAADAFDRILAAEGFEVQQDRTPDGLTRATEYRKGSQVVRLLVASPSDLAAPDLQPVAEVVGASKTLLLFLFTGS